MERRQIAGVVGAGLFSAGGAALLASLNPAIGATADVEARIGGTFGTVTGQAIFAVLFATARSSKAVLAKQAEVREKLGRYLEESRQLLIRSKAAGTDETFVTDAEAWFDGLCEYIRGEFGESAVVRLRQGADLVRYSTPGESRVASGLHIINVRLGQFLERQP